MQWRSKARQTEKRMRKRVIVLTILILAIVLPVCRYGPRVYSRWEQRRLTAQSQELLQKGDYKRAALSLRRTIELNPNNITATRLFAQLADKIGKPETVSLWERVCALSPNSFEDSYAWASAALKFGDTARAQQAASIMQKTGANRGGYHEILARLALYAGQSEEARSQFSEALKIEPENETYQLELATLDAQANDSSTREPALQSLQRLRAVPAFRLAALRVLVSVYATHGDIAAALPLAKELAMDPAAAVQDKLLYLSVLHGSRNPQFAAYLSSLQESAKDKEFEAAALIGWLNAHKLAMLSHEWLETLPQTVTSKPPVAPKAAETDVSLSDWQGLYTLTNTTSWGDSDFMRLAFLSLASLRKGDAAGSDAQWKTAVAQAAKRPDGLSLLEKTAIAWRWDARLEELRWFIAKTSKYPQQALGALVERYQRARDTHNLYRVVCSLHELDPANAGIKNNWVMLSLLLHNDIDQAAQAAQELCEANPTDVHAIATYGFALYMTNRTDDALEVMRKLTPEQLKTPSIAGYYGVMLAAVHDPEASKFLNQAQSQQLLPEEEQLFLKAKRSLAEL